MPLKMFIERQQKHSANPSIFIPLVLRENRINLKVTLRSSEAKQERLYFDLVLYRRSVGWWSWLRSKFQRISFKEQSSLTSKKAFSFLVYFHLYIESFSVLSHSVRKSPCLKKLYTLFEMLYFCFVFSKAFRNVSPKFFNYFTVGSKSPDRLP